MHIIVMKHLYTSLMAVAIAVSAVSLGTVGLSDATKSNALQGSNENVELYEGVNVHVYKNGKKVAETHNTLMEGKLAIENMMTGTDTHVWDTLVVGNGTAPSAGDGSLDSEWSGCGLGPKGSSIDGDVSADGEWNLTATWSSITCDNVIVNTTAQKSTGAASDEDYFAGAALSRDINLYSGDSLTIEWSNQVS